MEIVILLLILYLYFIFSYFVSNQGFSNFFSFNFFRYDGNFFFSYIPFFALSVPYLNYRKASKYYFRILFIVFSIFALIAVIKYIIGDYTLVYEYDETAGLLFTGLNFAHNATGSVYAVVSAFLLIFFLKEKNKKIKILYLFMFTICFIGLFLTKSRGSYVAFIVGVIYVFWFHYRSIKKFLITLLLMGVVSVPIIFLTNSYERIIKIFEFSGTTSVRFELWRLAWNLFKESPIVGIGFGRYNDILHSGFNRLYGLPGIIMFNIEHYYFYTSGHAHNSYLHFLAETGFIGLGLLLLFWIISFKKVFRAYKEATDNFQAKIFLSASTSIVMLFILSLTENYMSSTTVIMCISMTVSLAIGAYGESKRNMVK